MARTVGGPALVECPGLGPRLANSFPAAHELEPGKFLGLVADAFQALPAE